MENPIKMDDLGGFTPIFGNTQINLKVLFHGPLAQRESVLDPRLNASCNQHLPLMV